MNFTVSFAPEAEAQLLSLYRYVAGEASLAIAERFVGEIIERCEALDSFPLRGTPRDDIRPGLRTLAFRRRVTIAYSVIEDGVVVLGIYYGGQTVAALLADDRPFG